MPLPRAPILVAAVALVASVLPTGARGQSAEPAGLPPGGRRISLPLHAPRAGADSIPAARSDVASDSAGSASRIDLGAVQLGAVTSLTELLSSRVPGLLVQQSSGTTGTWSRIWLRGASSILLESEPLFIVDGVRVLSYPTTTLDIGGQLPSRIDDIPVEDIAAIDVLPGPSAAAIYGTEAAGGVIRITTRRGRGEGTRWSTFLEGGVLHESASVPANFQQLGTSTVTGSPVLNCTIDAQARNVCDATPGGLLSFNPIETVRPYRDGSRLDAGVSASGGRGWLRYFGGAGWEREEGVFENSDLTRGRARLNLDATPRRDLRLSLSSSFVSGDARFPHNGASLLGPLPGGMLGHASDDPDRHGYLIAPPNELATVEAAQDVSRVGGSLRADWSPLAWLTMSATAGRDHVDVNENRVVPAGLFGPSEARSFGSQTVERSTAAASALFSYPLPGGLRASTRVGGEYSDDEIESEEGLGDPGTVFLIETHRFESSVFGVFVEQRLSWRDRFHLSLGVRDDDVEIFGRVIRARAYPWAGLTWNVDREPFFTPSSILGSVRLRVAYGETGRSPSRFTQGQAVLPTAAEPKVERRSELEVGADAGLFRQWVRVSLAFYEQRSRDVLIPLGPAPPSVGFPGLLTANEGRVSNRGFEALVQAGPFETGDIDVSLSAGAWFNRNRLKEYAAGVPPLIFGTGNNVQRVTPGTALGGYWQRPLLGFQDLNGDGLIGRTNCPGGPQQFGGPACEVFLGDTAVFLGAPFPAREISLAPRVSLRGVVELTALIDHRGGLKQFNGSEALRCGGVQNCRAIQDASAPLAEQARAVALLLGSAAGYVEDASFWKLREVAVSFVAPASWASRLRASGARLTIAGRNLATWTDYSGLDPEVSGPRSFALERQEFFTQPAVRHFTARLSVTW
ncbi:MAG: TonB-dependent receptor domain-containing protein [Gemmatimonadaceae bacterium]